MFTRQNLDAAFNALGLEPPADLFQQLAQVHNQPERHYHNQQHVAACLSLAQRFARLADHPHEIELALWFHDAVYDARRNDNEQLSANWARQVLQDAEADPAVTDRIVQMILATQTHQAVSRDARLLLDIDLAILAASPPDFETYNRAIRREYAWVPEDQYRQGRRQVLSAFLERERIYQTDELAQLFEAPARENLARKIEELA